MRKSMSLVAGLALFIPGLARAAEPPCLSPQEFSSLAGYALPSVIKGTSKRCAATLGPDAFLTANGSQLIQRYAARKDASWPGAKAAFQKLSASSNDKANKVLTDMPDDSLKTVLDVILEGMVSQEIPIKDCSTIDGFVRLLSPLPAENMAELIALTVGLASKGEKPKLGKISVCPT